MRQPITYAKVTTWLNAAGSFARTVSNIASSKNPA
jgi:hypothetical protein